MAIVCIYKITSPTGKIYIGQTWNVYSRKKAYNSGHCKKQRKLYYSIISHGWLNHKFEVIHELPPDVDQEVLDRYEVFYWQQYKDLGFEMLNLQEPGHNGKHTLESKQLMSLSRIGNKNRLGKKGSLSTETRSRMSKAKNGVTFTEEHKENMSLNNPNRQPLIVYNLDKTTKQEFSSMNKASKELKICESTISRCLTGERRSRKYIFELL